MVLSFVIIGHYVPQLAELVHNRNKDSKKYPYINLKGFIVSLPSSPIVSVLLSLFASCSKALQNSRIVAEIDYSLAHSDLSRKEKKQNISISLLLS